MPCKLQVLESILYLWETKRALFVGSYPYATAIVLCDVRCKINLHRTLRSQDLPLLSIVSKFYIAYMKLSFVVF